MAKRTVERDAEGLPKWGGVEEVLRIRHRNLALRLVRLPCNKSNCRKCPHGPYWYLVTWRGGKATQWAIGRHLFREKLKAHPDKEILVIKILRETGERIDRYNMEYEPDGFDEKTMLVKGSGAKCDCPMCR